MRDYRSKLKRGWLPAELLREVQMDNSADIASNLTPRCCQCSAEQGKRVGVVTYGMEHSGRSGDGRYYTDFRAKCHGEEEVLRIKGLRWDAMKGEAHDLAAIAALPFFHRSTVH